MIPHDAALDAAYGQVAWEPYCRIRPVVDGIPQGEYLTPTGGEITWDDSQWPRVTGTILLPTAITPELTAPPVDPYGDTVEVLAGARVRGVLYEFRAATLDVSRTEVDRPSGTITVEVVSQEARVNEDRYDAVTPTQAGTATDVIVALVRRTLGAGWPIRVNVSTNPQLAAGAFTLDGDVWPVVESIADMAGAEVFFDYDGALVIRDTPRKAAPTLVLTTGVGGTITGYTSARSWAFNRVALVYEDSSTNPPGRVVGVWENTDPNSPTRVGGAYGRHTRRDTIAVEAGKLPTQAAANAAAADVGKRSAFNRSTDLRVIPCPWAQPGDTARVVMLGGLSEDHLLSRITWPLLGLDVAEIHTADDTGG